MKKNIVTTFALAILLLGQATSVSIKPVKLIEVPEYIGNYKTIDILEYFMKTKKVEVKESVVAPLKTVKKEQTVEIKKSEAKINKIMADDAHM